MKDWLNEDHKIIFFIIGIIIGFLLTFYGVELLYEYTK